MPWRCPACQIPINHSDSEHQPRLGQRYRCHVCRLELVVDVITSKLTVAPLGFDTTEDKARPTE
jgi:hypothetical protein